MEPIQTERLVLRNFQHDDSAGLFAYLHQPSAPCFFSMALKDMAAADDEVRNRGDSDEYLAVCLKETGRLIGDVFAMPEEDTYSIGWNFNPQFGGCGYATEAAQALVGHLFSRANARRLYAYVEEDNVPSRRVCERLGMRQEGMFIDFVSFENDESGAPVYVNTAQYALLRREWAGVASLQPAAR